MEAPEITYELRFTCNVCGEENRVERPPARERSDCFRCSSTLRYRATMHVLCTELLSESLILGDLPLRPDLIGLGLSDWECHVPHLAESFSYTNTHFGSPPHFDLSVLPPGMVEKYDFVVAGDVLEHVAPPIERALVNLRMLLKPGGLAVITVPFRNEGATTEHYPNLHAYEISGDGGREVLVNRKIDGAVERFEDPVFHGPGRSLEMRIFSRSGLGRALHDAGFEAVAFHGASYEPYGIIWPIDRSVPISARRPRP